MTPTGRSTFKLERRVAQRPAILFFWLATWIALPTTADWLVLKDGSRIETRGAWTEETRRVVFTMSNGTLSSLPLSEVDLDASHRASTARPEAPAARPEPALRPKATFVVTHDDVRQFKAPEARTDDQGEADPEPTASGGIEIVGWSDGSDPSQDGLQFFGTVRNTGNRPVAGLTLTVHLIDPGGNRRASSAARLTQSSLLAGATANFRVAFPDQFTYQDLEFEVGSQGSFLVTSDTPAATADGDPSLGDAPTAGTSGNGSPSGGQATSSSSDAGTGNGSDSTTAAGDAPQPDFETLDSSEIDDSDSGTGDDSDA